MKMHRLAPAVPLPEGYHSRNKVTLRHSLPLRKSGFPYHRSLGHTLKDHVQK